MKVLFGVPRYREVWNRTEDFQAEVLAAAFARRIPLGRYPGHALAGLSVDVARERLCLEAKRIGCDVVLMCDADVRLLRPAEALDLAAACLEGGFALLGAPVRLRDETSWNFLTWPAEREASPTEEDLALQRRAVRERAILPCLGYMGTGVSAVNVALLDRIERPWWKPPVEARDRTGLLRMSDDVAFSRRALAAGLRVGCHFGIRSGGHRTEGENLSEPVLDALARSLEDDPLNLPAP